MSAHEPTSHALPPPLPANAPPTTPGALPTKTPSWPNVVGGFSLGIGILGILAHICGIGTALFPKFLLDGAGASPYNTAQYNTITQSVSLSVISGTLSLLCALMLTVAGIGLLQHRRWSIGLHNTWAVVRLIAAVVSATLDYIARYRLMLGTSTSGQSLPAQYEWFVGLGLIGGGLALLWMAAYPVFILIFLNLKSTRDTFHHLR
jgi:hypothetical protein